MISEHAWVHVNSRNDVEEVTLTVDIGSIPQDSLVIGIAPDDWSKMLATHGTPVTATVKWMPRGGGERG